MKANWDKLPTHGLAGAVRHACHPRRATFTDDDDRLAMLAAATRLEQLHDICMLFLSSAGIHTLILSHRDWADPSGFKLDTLLDLHVLDAVHTRRVLSRAVLQRSEKRTTRARKQTRKKAR